MYKLTQFISQYLSVFFLLAIITLNANEVKKVTVAIDYEAGLVVAKLLKKLCEQNSLLPIEYDLLSGEITKKELVQLINARTKDIFDQL